MNTNNPVEQFAQERLSQTESYPAAEELLAGRDAWLQAAFSEKYMYNFDWLGRPIIQMPADIVGWQEVLWRDKPDLVIETGIAHGGSLILSASVLALLDLFDGNPRGTRRVLGVDIDIRDHNRAAIEAHPLSSNIDMIQGPSTEESVLAQVHETAASADRVTVALDSNHTHDHVLEELHGYAALTTPGLHMVVFDTVVEYLPEDAFPNRDWAPGNSPATAMAAYLEWLGEAERMDAAGRRVSFTSDDWFNNKLLASAAPGGYYTRD